MSLVDSCLVTCPYCGEVLELALDCPDGRHAYTEDCHVCCQPIAVEVDATFSEAVEVRVRRENG